MGRLLGRLVRAALFADGALLQTVEAPVQRPTSCAFGGAGLATLFITSARIGIEGTDLARSL